MYLQKIITITALILVMVFIFYMSARPGDDSSGMSRQVCAIVCQVFVPDYEALLAAEQENLISGMEFRVRKSVHCLEYMVLGILMCLTVNLYVKRTRLVLWVSLVAGILYAISDELHRYFVPGRSCELRDVMIDSFGVAVGVVAVLVFITWRKKKETRTGKN